MHDTYEIHYVQHGLKKVAVVHQPSMDALAAWKTALLLTGECAGVMLRLREFSEIVTKAQASGLRNVRWNKASHTVSWSERARERGNRLDVQLI